VYAIALIAAAAATAAGPDFDTQVLPVLTRAGCNTGACHGAATGQGGFALSLWGSDPAADYAAIVRQAEGRRVNLARPERSLLLLKPTGNLDHGGGVRLDGDSAGAAIVSAWLAAGAPRERLRQLTALSIEPTEAVLIDGQDAVALRVTATFDGGPPEDVTAWAVLTPADADAVTIDDNGLARVLRPGRHTVIVRYLDRVLAVQLTRPFAAAPRDLTSEPRQNFIDDEVLSVLQMLHLAPAPTADDAAFLRRVRLDLTGTLAAPDEVRAFLADGAPDKRARLVDRLLESPEFLDYWTLRLAKLLRVDSRGMDERGAARFAAWIREQLAAHRPWNELARDLLTADGDSHTVGPANFARATGDAREQAEHVSQSLAGLRLRCANCHNHPLDRWTQDDYHGLAAVFARVERGRIVRDGPRGEVTHPRTGLAAVPRLPGERFLAADEPPRTALAAWLTSPENPYFARAAVNRLWQAMFGRGLVEPVDDLRATNPASHPRLLDRLAEEFVSHGYDLRHTLRQIATSATYARSSAAPDADSTIEASFYAVARERPLGPEVLADAIAAATAVPDRYGDAPARAIALVDAAVEPETLAILGRCTRAAPCDDSGRVMGGGLPQALHLINGPILGEKLAAPEGRLATLLAAGSTDDEILEEFYLAALGRLPRDEEREFWSGHWSAIGRSDARARRELWEDIVWALLTSREFVTNH
jgi:hypothetical protein